MIKDGDSADLLDEAKKMDLDTVIVLGIKDEGGSVMIHNLDTDLDASFLLKTFAATLDMAILEELYARTKHNLN